MRSPRLPTNEDIQEYFGRLGGEILQVDESIFRGKQAIRIEILVLAPDSTAEIWAYDLTHGGGFWHQIGEVN